MVSYKNFSAISYPACFFYSYLPTTYSIIPSIVEGNQKRLLPSLMLSKFHIFMSADERCRGGPTCCRSVSSFHIPGHFVLHKILIMMIFVFLWGGKVLLALGTLARVREPDLPDRLSYIDWFLHDWVASFALHSLVIKVFPFLFFFFLFFLFFLLLQYRLKTHRPDRLMREVYQRESSTSDHGFRNFILRIYFESV